MLEGVGRSNGRKEFIKGEEGSKDNEVVGVRDFGVVFRLGSFFPVDDVYNCICICICVVWRLGLLLVE